MSAIQTIAIVVLSVCSHLLAYSFGKIMERRRQYRLIAQALADAIIARRLRHLGAVGSVNKYCAKCHGTVRVSCQCEGRPQ